MNLFSDATLMSFLRDICVIMAFYLAIEHGLKILRRNATRVRVTHSSTQTATRIGTRRTF